MDNSSSGSRRNPIETRVGNKSRDEIIHAGMMHDLSRSLIGGENILELSSLRTRAEFVSLCHEVISGKVEISAEKQQVVCQSL